MNIIGLIRTIKFGIVIRNVSLLIVTSVFVLVYVQYINNNLLLKHTKNLVHTLNQSVHSRIKKNFQQIESVLQANSPLIKEMIIKKKPEEIYSNTLISYIKDLDFISSFSFAIGDTYFAVIKKALSTEFYKFDTTKHLPEHTQFSWRIISSVDESDKKRIEKFYYFDNKLKLLDSEQRKDEPDFYPTKRPWYVTDKHKEVNWTDVYLFQIDKRPPGITASIGIFDKDDVQLGVYAVDIQIVNLKKILMEAKAFEDTSLYLIDSSNQIISSTEEIPLNISPEEKPKLPLVTDEKYSFLKQVIDANKESEIDYLEINGKKILSQVSTIEIGKLKLFLISKTPEESILREAKKMQLEVLYTCFLFVLFSGLFMFLFARKISIHIKRLSVIAQKIERFESIEAEPVRSSIVEIQQLSTAMHSMHRSISTFSKYVPKDLVLKLMKNDTEEELGGEQKEITLFFSDIEGFTTISERLKPHELLEQLTDYFTLLTDVITNHAGTVDKYIGDAIMAFWGAPEKISNHAYLACHTALEIQRLLRLKNSDWINLGRLPFTTRLGIHTSPVIVGNIGSKTRFNYTALGDDVNLCARLEGLNKYYGTYIIISQDTYAKVNGDFYARPLGKVAVKGKKEAVSIYELIGAMKHVDTSLLMNPQTIKDYEKYLVAYEYIERRRFASALEILEDISVHDGPVLFLISVCKDLMTKDLDDSWEGIVNHMTSK